MSKEKTIAIISGGLDSLVAIASACHDFEVILALTFDYGQFAADQEIKAASAISMHYSVKHMVLPLPFWKNLPEIALVSKTKTIPEVEISQLANVENAKIIDRELWVPNRNGVFIHVAAVYAEALNASVLVTGFNAEEGITFPDNSIDFIKTMNENLKYSTLNHVRIESPAALLNKKEIVELGLRLDAPMHLLYSCYHGRIKMCGKCPSCVRCIEAFRSANVLDMIQDRFEYEI
jgi:7-cyano-7-deazaguanine synthase